MDDIRQYLARLFDLPEDLMLNLPRLTAVGNLQLMIENHQGILAFSASKVVIATSMGRISVTGEDLLVGAVDREVVILTGKIHDVVFGDR